MKSIEIFPTLVSLGLLSIRIRKKLLKPATHIYLALVFLCFSLGLGIIPQRLHAQEQVGSYTVQAGDTLAVIAERFGVPLDALITINNIQNRNLIAVGQVLLIPTADTTLNRLPTAQVFARPGETLADVVRRYEQDPQLITALNSLALPTRLFPGQPIAIPLDQAPLTATAWGAIERIDLPDSLMQGRTGNISIQSRRPLSISVTWNGLPLPLSTIEGTADELGTDQVALLPVPALIAPASYTVTVAYTANSGVVLERHHAIQVLEGPYESQEILLPDDKGSLLDPEIGQDELALLSSVWSQVTPIPWWELSFTRPIAIEYATTSPYGTRRSYNGGPYSSYHAGQDFGAPAGVPIVAPAAGRVALAAPLQVRGNAILLDHGGGIYTGYWHLSEISVLEGQVVEQGDVLGLVGTTGLSTGAHLHWELRIYGIAVDPMQYLAEPLLSR